MLQTLKQQIPNDTLFDYNFFGSSETVKVEPTAAQLQGAKDGSNCK